MVCWSLLGCGRTHHGKYFVISIEVFNSPSIAPVPGLWDAAVNRGFLFLEFSGSTNGLVGRNFPASAVG